MKKYLLLLILSNVTLPLCYSQSTGQLPLKEINHYLAEGLEAKELLIEKSNQVAALNAIVSEQKTVIENLQKQAVALEENYTIAKERAGELYYQLQEKQSELDKANKEVVRIKKGRNTWRTIAAIETAIIAVAVVLIR